MQRPLDYPLKGLLIIYLPIDDESSLTTNRLINGNMKVALIIDQSSLVLKSKSMYVSELEGRLKSLSMNPETIVVSNCGLFQKLDPTTGIMRVLNSSKIMRAIKDYDIIHAQFTYPVGFAIAFFGTILRENISMVVHTHGYDVFSVPSINYGVRRNIIGKALTNYAWKKARRVIAVCEKACVEIANSGVPPEKIDLLYNGVDEKLFSRRSSSEVPTELRRFREDSDLLFLTVGSDMPVKNRRKLVECFTTFVEGCNSNYKFKLLVVGGSHPPTSFGEGANPNVLFIGNVKHEELPVLYSLADVFILPSLSEAHPWSLLEAMSCEMVVLGACVGGIPETIADSNFLLDPWNSHDILDKLKFIRNLDENDRKQIGKRNRKIILDRFTLDRHMQNLQKIYKKTLEYE